MESSENAGLNSHLGANVLNKEHKGSQLKKIHTCDKIPFAKNARLELVTTLSTYWEDE